MSCQSTPFGGIVTDSVAGLLARSAQPLHTCAWGGWGNVTFPKPVGRGSNSSPIVTGSLPVRPSSFQWLGYSKAPLHRELGERCSLTCLHCLQLRGQPKRFTSFPFHPVSEAALTRLSIPDAGAGGKVVGCLPTPFSLGTDANMRTVALSVVSRENIERRALQAFEGKQQGAYLSYDQRRGAYFRISTGGPDMLRFLTLLFQPHVLFLTFLLAA